MVLVHVTKTGNISIPKKWRDELGIEANSDVLIQRKGSEIIIEPLTKRKLKDSFKAIDDEVKRKKIVFTHEEALRHDLYD